MRGTLLIDFWDARTKQIVWRGSVESVVSENPEQVSKDIYKAIDKLAEAWHQKYKGGKG